MNTKFTVEESNLISIFEDKSRKKVIHNIRDVREHLDDEEMVELNCTPCQGHFELV